MKPPAKTARAGAARHVRTALGLVLLLSGCSAELTPDPTDAAAPPPSDAAPPRGDGATIAPPDATPLGPGAADCPAEHYYVGRLRGQVRTSDGAPVANAQVGVCGNVCVSRMAGADGNFDVAIDQCFAPTAEYPHGVVMQLAGVGLRPDLYFDFNPTSARRIALFELPAPARIPLFASGFSVAAPNTATREVTLSDGRGFSLRVVPTAITYPLTALDEVLRAVRVPDGAFPPMAGAPPPAVLFALGPSETTFRAPAPLELPNTARLAAGTAVQIVAIGAHASEGNPPIGALGVVDTGRVSADGARVVADRGIRFLSWVGYRAAPAR